MHEVVLVNPPQPTKGARRFEGMFSALRIPVLQKQGLPQFRNRAHRAILKYGLKSS